jgi:signal transduction histidine kinase/CheY-like chemotaxis protein
MSEEPATGGPALRVLVVEDNLADAFRVQEVLRDRGLGQFETTVVGRVRDAVPRLDETDIVLLDLSLPDGSGLDLLDQVRLRTPILPVVILSGRRDEESALECLRHGAQEVLVKGGSDGSAIARALRCAMGRKALADGAGGALETARLFGENLMTLVNASREGFVVADRDGRAYFLNPAAEDLLGWLPGQGSGRELDLPLTGNGPVEVERRGPDGETRMLEVRSVRLLWEGKPALLVHLHDLSPRRRSEQTRKDLEDQRRELEWLGALGRLAGGIAHGLNNQLTVILGNASMILEGPDAPEPVRDLARRIEESGWGAADLVAQLLACAGRQMSRPATLDLNQALEDLRSLVADCLTPGIVLRWEVQAGLPNARIDRRLLGQALMLLVEHARDSMRGGGEMRVRVFRERDEGEGKGGTKGDARSRVVVAVSDTGPGLGAEARRRLFEPFYTAEILGIGSGLGLAPVHGIARQSGGAVEVESVLGRGTTVRLILPGIDDGSPPDLEPPTTALPAAEQSVLPRGSETILVVESDGSFNAMIGTALEELGYRVLTASDAGDAVRLSASVEGPLDLLVAEAKAAGMRGSILAKVLRCRRAGLQAILLGSPDEADADALDAGQGNHLVLKPFRRRDFAFQVRMILDALKEGRTDPPRAGD